METKIKNTVPFNLGVGDTNHGQNLCAGKYKMLVKEIKDQNTWRDILRSWIGRLSIIKVSTFLKLIYRFNIILKSQQNCLNIKTRLF